ncbi:MAG: hypothetical protein IKT41_05815 [Clostridia bacterium]|nr:hypothetical protein [Clostridia bacterium]
MSKDFEEKVLKKLEQLDTLSEEFKQFRKEQREFNAKQEKFNAKQEEFNAKQEELNTKILKRLDIIEKNVVIIEDRVTNEIPALFDADKTRNQKQLQFETTLDSLDQKTEDHAVRILALEYTSEKHEGQLKDLVS